MKTQISRSIVMAVIFITASLLAGSVSHQSIAKDKNAKISFTELSHDFGKVEEGIELTHIFKFKNTGDGILIINSVNAGCGCTGVMMSDKKEYSEGEEGEIKVSFNTQGRSGLQSKNVIVTTNDPDMPEIILSFTCEIN
jgi:hypothetical protein